MADQSGGSPIRTPDQRLRVFISSTLGELAEERAAVARAVESLHLTPVMFELGARPHPPRELYRAYLAQSDLFVGIYWQRYGWIGPDSEISGLEDEFQLSSSMPRLLYVKAPAPEREPGLISMIEHIQTTGSESYRTFRDAEELDRLVRDDIALILSERFATERTATRPPGRQRSLPVPSTSLIGRDRDIEAAAELLGAADARLLTITGPGGIGKTRLAIAVAERIDATLEGGAVFVSLASITEPELVMPKIAGALGGSVEGSRPALDVVVDHLTDTPTLLVLDNLEQVVDVAAELDTLLTRCPLLRVLATSRTALRLRAEREYPVAALAVPPRGGEISPGSITACSCVELFVDRARAVRHDFALTDDNARAVAEICRRLDGLPLAIELAAARTRLLAPPDLLTRLERSLDALGAGPVDLPERQRTLRATVEWSIDLLSADERDVLAVLTVFVDGWTLEAAAHVAALPDDRVLDLLDSLAGHSLVQVDLTADGARFQMLESVRELAAELRTERSDACVIEQRHAEYFRDLVTGMNWPGERQFEWAGRLHIEEENVRAAIRWFLANDISPLPHMFRVLWLFWQMSDRMVEGREWIDELLDQLDEFGTQGKVELLLTSAVTAVEVGDDVSALAAAEALDALDEPITDPFLANSANLALAWIRPINDDLEGALQAAIAAYEGFLASEEPFMAASAAMTTGMASMTLGRYDVARQYLGKVEQLGGRSGNNWLELGARTQLATLSVITGDLDEARRLVAASVDVDDVNELSTYTLTFALVAFARVAMADGQPDQAALALGAAEALRARAGVRPWPAIRGIEHEFVTAVRGALDSEVFDRAFSRGADLTAAEAFALLRNHPGRA